MQTPNYQETAFCLNCNREFIAEEKFCSGCGQKKDIHRFTPGHLAHEVFHAFTHTDKSIFNLLKCLATRPGTTAREYIHGKRKKYFNPFTFFLVLMAFFIFSNKYLRPTLKTIVPDANVLKYMPTEEARTNYTAVIKRVNTTNIIFRKNSNLVAMVAIPIIALFTWLFFKRRGFNYTEHVVAMMMYVAFGNLVFSLFINPLEFFIDSRRMVLIITFTGMFLQILYFTWALNGLFELKRAGERLKSFLVSLFCILFWAFFSMTVMAIYIYQSGDFYKFFTRLFGG